MCVAYILIFFCFSCIGYQESRDKKKIPSTLFLKQSRGYTAYHNRCKKLWRVKVKSVDNEKWGLTYCKARCRASILIQREHRFPLRRRSQRDSIST